MFQLSDQWAQGAAYPLNRYYRHRRRRVRKFAAVKVRADNKILLFFYARS